MVPSKCSRTLILIILMLSPGLTRAASLTLYESAKHLDPFIQSVTICGSWSYDHEEGSFRIIYGWLWGHTEIYVQWVAAPIWYPKKGQTERRFPLVMKTASFPEFDHYEAATDLKNVQCLQQDDRWILRADANNSNDDDPKTSSYRLIIHLYDEPGKFKIETLAGSDSTPNKSEKKETDQ